MAKHDRIPVSNLLVDCENPRLSDAVDNQPAALRALAKGQKSKLIRLAEDIVSVGLNPGERLFVTPADGKEGFYVVLDGNRRVTALKGLETPALLEGALTAGLYRMLNKLSDQFAKDPILEVDCCVVENRDESDHWLQTLHGGELDGAGRVRWGTPERERYEARRGRSSPALQVTELLMSDPSFLDEETRESKRRIHTSLNRALSNPEVRAKLGIHVKEGVVQLEYPKEQVVPALARLYSDLKLGRESSRTLNKADDLRRYAAEFSPEVVPAPATRLDSPITAAAATAAAAAATSTTTASTDTGATSDESESKEESSESEGAVSSAKSKPRRRVIPAEVALPSEHPRIKAVFDELKQLDPNKVPNACAVLLRVLLELSVNDYIEKRSLVGSGKRQPDKLKDRIQLVVKHLDGSGVLKKDIKLAMNQATSRTFVHAASTVTLNQYVHNQYVFPKASDLLEGWDQLQPFMALIWMPPAKGAK